MIFNAVIDVILILALAGLSAWAGYKISRSTSKAWLIWFGLSFVFVIAVMLLHRIPTLAYHPVFQWVTQGANEVIVMAICGPLCFAILVPRLRFRRQKIIVGFFAALTIIYYIVPPFVDPAILYAQMEDSDTWVEDGVCLQTTGYTCGAASAVTALKQLGIDANEMEMAIASGTSRTFGATEYKLAWAIETLYGNQGIHCDVKTFEQLTDLKDCCPVIVEVKYRPMVDHYITVLEIGDTTVLVGDPLKGKERLTYTEFLDKWRKAGIIVSKKVKES